MSGRPESGGELSIDLCSISSSANLIQNVETGSENVRVVPIHRRPDLLVPCADLVNSEWQRSQAARVHSLQKSCPEFPVCLVLLRGHKEREQLLGHARLTRVIGHSSSLFVESVVVSTAERGKGYGRTLMKETECYAKTRGFKRLCLTTHDKQHFYSHIDYVLSTPVQNAGAMMKFVPMEMLLRFSRMPCEVANMQKLRWAEAQEPQKKKDSGGACVVELLPLPSLPPPSYIPPPSHPLPSVPPFSLPVPHPPPPPLPFVPSPSITSPALPSLYPPPPPLPPQSVEHFRVQTLTETPYRDVKGVPMFWMHKDI